MTETQKKGIGAYWQLLNDKVNDLTLRERVILLLTGIVLLSMILIQVWLAPVWGKISEARKQMADIRTEQVNLAAQLESLQKQLAVHPDDTVKQQIAALRSQLEGEKRRLQETLAGVVSPSEMVRILHNVLGSAKGLTLVSMEKLPVRPIHLSGEDKDEAAVLYEHDVKLVLQGGYFDTLAYISALEARAATLTLSLLDYRVETYPRAEITLQVSTLSLDPEWLAL
ncbi:hypothetical protein AAIA72_14300 [Hahella sp. SMD15-11]|uniref:MSHA biogenesis protein MshJ n=1 Tax=Thermohahella caldifontis TaxID=3142973 RepID=A0AB39UUJ8_9GAMM